MSVKRTWAKLANTHLVLLLLVTFFVFAYRDLWPLATYTLRPVDAYEGGLFWAKCAVLTFTAVVIPLVIPRQYVPFDSEVRDTAYKHFFNGKSHLRFCLGSCPRT